MKKYISIVLAALVVATAFVACSKADDQTTTVAESTSSIEYQLKENEIVTDEATIKSGEAANFIKNSYSIEELGLADKENYSFMEHGVGLVYNGNNYVVVEAMVKTVVGQDENGNDSYHLDTVGTYLVSFDGQEVLMKDGDTYKELENRYADYQAMMETSTVPADHETTAE